MSIKRNLVLAAAGIAALSATAALAGGPDNMCPPQEPEQKMFVYAELGTGYAWQGWNTFNKASFTGYAPTAQFTTNKDGGMVGLADFGFQFLNHWAIEGGGVYLPRTQGSIVRDASGATRNGNGPGKTYNVLYYTALRLSAAVPYLEDLEGFVKAGVGFRGIWGKSMFQPFRSYRTNVLPLFGVGAKYLFWDTGFSVNTQFLYVPGRNTGDGQNAFNATSTKISHNIPAAYVLTGGVGYQFDF